MASKKKLNKNAREKSRFRATEAWKQFRHQKNIEQGGLDPITCSKLPKMAHLHHKDLNKENYTDISNTDNFVLLQPTSHKAVHWGLTQIKKRHTMEIIERYVKELQQEAILNGFIDEDDILL